MGQVASLWIVRVERFPGSLPGHSESLRDFTPRLRPMVVEEIQDLHVSWTQVLGPAGGRRTLAMDLGTQGPQIRHASLPALLSRFRADTSPVPLMADVRRDAHLAADLANPFPAATHDRGYLRVAVAFRMQLPDLPLHHHTGRPLRLRCRQAVCACKLVHGALGLAELLGNLAGGLSAVPALQVGDVALGPLHGVPSATGSISPTDAAASWNR